MDKTESREQKALNHSGQLKKGDGIGFKILSTLLVMYVLTGILLFGMAFLLYRFQLGETFVTLGVIVVYVASGFVGGLLLRRRLKSPCGFLGLLIGTVYFMVLFLGSVILGHGLPQEMIRMAAVWIMCACSGMLGGMISGRH